MKANFVVPRRPWLAWSSKPAGVSSIHRILVLLLLCVAGISSAWAQTVQFQAGQVRVTVPLNSTSLTIITNWVDVADLGSAVSLDVSGLPAGAGYSLTDANSNLLSSTITDTNLWLWLRTTNIAQGVHTFSLNGTGGATNRLRLVLQAGHIWNGSTNAAADGAGLWSDSSKWLGGVPGAGDDVIFTDSGGQSNLLVVGATSTNYLTNCVIAGDVTVGSLRFAQTNGGYGYHNLQINPGRTLSIVGSNGFSLLRDYVDDLGQPGTFKAPLMSVSIAGQGARMVVSNQYANLAILLGGEAQPSLNLSNLDMLMLDVKRVGLGDYRLYPNYWNYQDNGYGSYPRRWACHVYWARTNIIKANYKDPGNYTNEFTRQYGLVWQNSERYGSGSSLANFFYFGISNWIQADGVCFLGRSHSPGNTGKCGFNPAFASDNPVAIFRGTNGGRMSMFCLGDDGGTNGVTGNIKATVDFASANGYVDILADRFIMSRDTALVLSNATPTTESTLYIGRGIVDVNDAILGFQEHESKTNWLALGPGENYRGYCRATLQITNGATFKVNRTLIVGYTADTNYFNSPADGEPQNGFGRITIANGSTLMASNIVVDPGLGLSGGGSTPNQITLQDDGRLIVTNGVSYRSKKLGVLNMSDSSLTLHVRPSFTNIHVASLVTGGSGNVINIASVSGVSSYPATLPIISYDGTASPNFAIGSLPSGLVGSVVNNPANKTVDLTVTTNVPQTLVWRGNVNGLWTTSAADNNWVTADGGVQTNFNDGDFVVFDDTATNFTVSIAADVTPGQSPTVPGILVSNSTHHYTFLGGGGRVIGGTTLRKVGTANLTFDATSESSVHVLKGSMTGGGSIGSTVVGAGCSVSFSGAISGGLVTTGSVAVATGGSITGPITLCGGAGLINLGTITSQISLQAETYLTNAGIINVTVPWSVPTNSTLVNNGTIIQTGPVGGNQGLSVNAGGTLKGVGTIETGGANNDGRVTINNGGTFIIGNSANEIANVTMATRLDFMAGSTTTFDVDLSTTNDVIRIASGYLLGKVNFGANALPGGTLVINRLGSTPFSYGQTLYLFDQTSNTPDNSVPAWPGVIPAPGPGWAWDYSDMVTNLTLRVGSLPVFTNAVVDTNWVFSWAQQYVGWRLEAQTNSLTVGLSTNWGTVPGSFVTNWISQPIVSTNPAVFYRLAYP